MCFPVVKNEDLVAWISVVVFCTRCIPVLNFSNFCRSISWNKSRKYMGFFYSEKRLFLNAFKPFIIAKKMTLGYETEGKK